jgi:hypothetical protein
LGPAAILSVLVQAEGIAETNRKLKNVQSSSEQTAKSTEKLEGRFSRLDNTVGDFNRTFTASGNVMKLVKFPAMIAGAGMAAQAVGALAAGGVALGSALAPLSGLAAAGAAGYVALGQAAGVVKLATHGLTDALGGNKDALKALPPAGRELVALLKDLKPKFTELQQAAQAGLLPGLAEGIKAALPALRPLKSIISGTAGALGDLVAQAGKLVGSKGVLRDLTTIGQTNIGVIRNAGTAALLLAHAFIGVVAEAGPLVTWLSRLGVQLAGWIDKQVTAGRESGKLAGFLRQTRNVASTLIDILVNLGAGLYNIGKAAAPLGRDLLGMFEKLTEKFRAWTESASGKNQIAAYFQNARGPILQIVGLIGDIGGALLRISQGKGASTLVAQLRTLVPVLENVVTSTTAAFGPALIDALGNVLRLFGLLAGSSGPLVQLVRLIGLIAAGLTALLTSVPGLNSMTVSFIGLYGTVKALSVVFGPLLGGLKLLEAALIGQATATGILTGATISERIALVSTAVAMYAARAATIAMTVATTALDVALAVLTSSITLVIVGLAALAAGIIYAYKHSETFRNIVNAMWAVLKVVAAWMITAGVAAFNAVANAAKVAWGVVDTVTRTVWNGLKAFLTALWGVLKTLATAYFNGYKTVITGAWTAIQTATTVTWGAIKAVTVGVWNALKDSAGAIWGGIRAAILTPIRAVRDLLGGKDGIWAQMRDAAHDAWEKIKTGAGNFAGDLKTTIVKAFEGAVNAVIDFVNKIIDVINVIPGIPNIKHIGHVGGSSPGKGKGGPNGTGHLAKGGMVPGTGYGDKVPLHIAGKLAAMVEPGELVSVANRNATAALMGVNSAIPRFQTGGIFNSQEMSDLWRSKGGGASIADTMGVIGLVESGGNPRALNPSGAAGLWQILGQLVPGNLFNPGVNALNAIAKYKSQGLSAWDASKSKWSKLIGKVVGPDLNPLDLINKLPGIGDLPDWLKGTGKYVIGHVGDWIKDNVAKLIPGGGGGGTKGPKGVGTFNGIPMADWVIDSLNYGRKHGAYGNPTSGYRPGYDSHTATGASEHQGTQYPHGAVDFGGYTDARALAEKLSYVHATAGYKYPLLAPKGFHDDGHASGTGHQMGGIVGPRLPFLGAYHRGGVAPTEGYARVSAGERMTPAGSGPLVNIEHAEFGSQIDVNSFAAKLGFKIATA